MLKTGVVKWFSRVKGYGFISDDETGDEYFAHYSKIVGVGYRNLNQGDHVSFDGVDGPKGLAAENIKVKKS